MILWYVIYYLVQSHPQFSQDLVIKTCCPTHSLRTSVSGLEELEKSYLPLPLPLPARRLGAACSSSAGGSGWDLALAFAFALAAPPPGLAFAFAFGNGIDRALDSTVKEAWALGPGHVHLIDSENGQQAVQDIIPIILGPA